MGTLNLGKILTDDMVVNRDALHIAIAPVVATEMLAPGETIDFIRLGDTINVKASDAGIGIVDPFLKASVLKGQRFWMYLMPDTITSLRHEWTHPSFVGGPIDDHIKWITEFASNYGESYRDMMDAADGFQRSGYYWNEGGKFEGEYVPDEFWDHYNAIRDVTVPTEKRNSFFTCSC